MMKKVGIVVLLLLADIMVYAEWRQVYKDGELQKTKSYESAVVNAFNQWATKGPYEKTIDFEERIANRETCIHAFDSICFEKLKKCFYALGIEYGGYDADSEELQLRLAYSEIDVSTYTSFFGFFQHTSSKFSEEKIKHSIEGVLRCSPLYAKSLNERIGNGYSRYDSAYSMEEIFESFFDVNRYFNTSCGIRFQNIDGFLYPKKMTAMVYRSGYEYYFFNDVYGDAESEIIICSFGGNKYPNYEFDPIKMGIKNECLTGHKFDPIAYRDDLVRKEKLRRSL